MFQKARIQAELEVLLARLTGKPIDLLDYEEVRRKLRAESTGRRVLKEIPLDAIVGSVGRRSDFTRAFLPRHESDERRWTQVGQKVMDSAGLPPIEAYQIDGAYFVIDGNHRVSVAREMGAKYIETYVTEVKSRVPVTPELDSFDLLLKARYVEFLERTQLDRLRPGADLQVSDPDAYAELERHIELHRYLMSVELEREAPYSVAVSDWYDKVYLAVVQVIRDQGALKDFPGRTEADLYLSVSGYCTLLEEFPDWATDLDQADALSERGESPLVLQKVVGMILNRLRGKDDALMPGEWRRAQVLASAADETRRAFRLFTNILVPVTGEPAGWSALACAAQIAKREHGRLLGLHVAPDETTAAAEQTRALRTEFEQRCVEAGVPGKLSLAAGAVAQTICERSRWVDLVVLRLGYPPPQQPLAQLGSGFRTLIQRCNSPLLVIPDNANCTFDRALVAYDHSPKAEQALAVAAYLALHWDTALTIISVSEKLAASQMLSHARDYLNALGIHADYCAERGPVAKAILQVAARSQSNLIILGGYGFGPVLQLVLGSTVDQIFRTSVYPSLIYG